MKLDSDRRNGTDFFTHKFVGKVEAIFNGLPKPKDRRSLYNNDLPLITDIDPKLAVHRSNNQNRDATPGQKAMATAMAFPEGGIGGRGKQSINPELNSGFTDRYLRMARYVLRNSPMVEGERYPRRCFPHGQFLPWIAAEFEMSDRTAYDMINIAKRFGGNDFQFIGNHFSQTVLARLSAPSTPESVIEKAIEQAESGEKVTVAGAVPIRQCPSPPPHQRPKSDGLCY